jgi:ABC-type molybdenum transport system ATPase subunit/photorepair protein PhrA
VSQPGTVRDVIGTGLEGTWSLRRELTGEEARKVNEIVQLFCPQDYHWETFATRSFERLSALEQALVLLMRALIGRPPLLLLDEAFPGMERSVRDKVRGYVGEEQAVVIVSHWDDEVPWGVEDGLRIFRLDGGERCENGE